MALINCNECRKEISSAAHSCVHCGYRVNQTVFVQDLGFDGQIFRLLIAVGIIVLISSYWFGFPIFLVGTGVTFFGIIFLLIRALK